mgnify:CR=1 FL=1
MKKRFVNASRRSLLGATLAVGLGFGATSSFSQTTTAAVGPAVKAVAVGKKSVANYSDIDGVVEAVMQSTLSSQIPGRVLSLNVKAGDRVKAGQVLATIDDRETQTGVLRSQAQLQQSDAELRQLQIALKRTQELKTQGFVSSAALDLAEAQYKAAQAGRDSAGAASAQAKVTQTFSKITAPYDAWVLETSVQAGDLAMPGKPLMTVYAPQPLRVVLQWPASQKNALPKLNDIQIQGNDTKKYSALNFVGVETTGSNILNVSNMTHLHLNVWTANMTEFRVKLVDFGNDLSYAGGDDTEHELSFTPNLENWMTLDISLTDFVNLASNNHIAQLIFSGNPIGNGVVYVDNVLFHTMVTGLEEQASNVLRLFPNPTNDFLTISTTQEISSIEIHSISGALIEKCSANNQRTLNVSNLKEGTYFCVIKTMEGEVLQQKFIKN